jgi:hypothetical protein
MSHRSGIDGLTKGLSEPEPIYCLPKGVAQATAAFSSEVRDKTYVEGRIENLSYVLDEITHDLDAITDRMEGSQEKEGLASPVRSGWIGDLETLIERAQTIRGKVNYLSDKI